MSFKKLNPAIKETLSHLEMEHPTPFQKKIIPRIKSGANVFGIAPEGSGKTTALIIGTIQQLKAEAFQDAPRALIFVKDKEAALELEEKFQIFLKNTSLRIFSAFDEPNIENQKNEIYEGVDIVISTPKKLKKLFKISGINLNELKILAVEDADFLVKTSDFNDLIGIPEHVSKCQFLVFSEALDGKVKRLQDFFMSHSEVVIVD
ncbi:DEAD/DEAH box helicase [Salinimicrobium sp. GXAS 041]|uniref:DEAD/DEAH box helicase n=1 Tax=Salinimicrobium sp. GXAS 041 TaxID=3400806 RepID=UPI003C769089